MELESFVVVMDSNYPFNNNLGPQNRQYYFDWSVIPDGKYEMTFSIVTDNVDGFTPTIQYSIFSNMISPQNVYKACASVGAITCPYLGTLTINPINSTDGISILNNLNTPISFNPPVICNRPMTNIFTIGIYQGFTGNLAGYFPDYILTLYFKPLRMGLA